jgi:hypothetical protein
MSEELRDTCVYAHYRKSDGLMFYIGIGTNERPYEYGRNQHWNNVVAKHGYRVEVLLTDLTWAEACAVEVEMIAAFRSDLVRSKAKLTNLTDGGDGAKGWSKDPRNVGWVESLIVSKRKLAESPEWRRNVAEAARKRSASPEGRARMAAMGRKMAQDPEWVRKSANVAINRAADPSYRQRAQMGWALRDAFTPHSRLLPGIYPWLYRWHVDGKVYAKPFKEKAPPVSTDEAS